MITPDDIENLTEYQKEVFVTKKDLKKVEDKIDILLTSVDGIAKMAKDNTQEIGVLHHRVQQVEDFAKASAPKLGVEFNT